MNSSMMLLAHAAAAMAAYPVQRFESGDVNRKPSFAPPTVKTKKPKNLRRKKR